MRPIIRVSRYRSRIFKHFRNKRLLNRRFYLPLDYFFFTLVIYDIEYSDLTYRQDAWNDVRCSEKCGKARYVKNCMCT